MYEDSKEYIRKNRALDIVLSITNRKLRKEVQKLRVNTNSNNAKKSIKNVYNNRKALDNTEVKKRYIRCTDMEMAVLKDALSQMRSKVIQ